MELGLPSFSALVGRMYIYMGVRGLSFSTLYLAVIQPLPFPPLRSWLVEIAFGQLPRSVVSRRSPLQRCSCRYRRSPVFRHQTRPRRPRLETMLGWSISFPRKPIGLVENVVSEDRRLTRTKQRMCPYSYCAMEVVMI